MNVVERSGLTLDTRLVPATKGAPRPGTCLYLLHRGAFVLDDRAPGFEGPAAFLLSEQHLEGANGVRPSTFRAFGSPFAAIEMHLADADVTARSSEPCVSLDVDKASWAAVGRVIGLAREATDDTREPLCWCSKKSPREQRRFQVAQHRAQGCGIGGRQSGDGIHPLF